MNQELSDFAARLREVICSFSGVAAEVTGLQFQEPETRIPGSDRSEPPHVGSYDNHFDSLALELFALQFKHNTAYRKICEARDMAPGIIEHWTQIPAVPAAAFKELELSCIPSEERTAVFHSSGTTEQKPSRHFHCAESLEIYEASLWFGFETQFLRGADSLSACFRTTATRGQAVRAPFIILTPPPVQTPHSSLVYMFETVRKKLDAEFGVPPSGGRVNAELQTKPVGRAGVFMGTTGSDGAWTLDFDAVLAALNSSLATCHPSLLLGTAFSFVHLLDFLIGRGLRFRLPPGSRVMETGGYKNRSRAMAKEELHALLTERLGVPREDIICEYGMSELSSQAYALGAPASRRREDLRAPMKLAGETPALPGDMPGHFLFPPWARVQIISPETGCEVAGGETGLIHVFDLANVFSVMAVQTEDLGVRRGDGFELIGRARLAEPRGCSLMMDEPLAPSLSLPGGERGAEGRVRGQ